MCKSKLTKRFAFSVDGVKLKRNDVVYVLFTLDGCKTWNLTSKQIKRTNHRGMVSFEDKPEYWHYCWYSDNVGDHRIYLDFDNAIAEMNRRNFKNFS